MSENALGEAIMELLFAARSEEYIQGFNDATGWLLDPAEDSPELKAKYCNPPAGLDGCLDCLGETVAVNDCPRCQYDLGFTEGACK